MRPGAHDLSLVSGGLPAQTRFPAQTRVSGGDAARSRGREEAAIQDPAWPHHCPGRDQRRHHQRSHPGRGRVRRPWGCSRWSLTEFGIIVWFGSCWTPFWCAWSSCLRYSGSCRSRSSGTYDSASSNPRGAGPASASPLRRSTASWPAASRVG